jgi:hypothetical protein
MTLLEGWQLDFTVTIRPPCVLALVGMQGINAGGGVTVRVR